MWWWLVLLYIHASSTSKVHTYVLFNNNIKAYTCCVVHEHSRSLKKQCVKNIWLGKHVFRNYTFYRSFMLCFEHVVFKFPAVFYIV